MQLRLSLGNHPDPEVVTGALPSGGAYFRTCWGPLMGPLVAHVAGLVGGQARAGGVETSFDAFSQEVFPEPIDPPVRSIATLQVLRELDERGFGTLRSSPPAEAEFVLFRQVALVPPADLTRLTDVELECHVLALVEVSERRDRAGLGPVSVPHWMAERLDRARSGRGLRPPEAVPTDRAGELLARPTSAPSGQEAMSL